ncbi:MAG: BMP family ABC transporter substrate-binding protein, partial [Chloroflexi bacterium]|nr:BMP family ABC transporter substrate-binding protein [Chloroflexota bacterium]MCI0729133.1 BMP family ABC transporter substrate-binding protein [Chloroflexota bacterium]
GLTGTLTCDEFGDCADPRIEVVRLDDPAAGITGLKANVVFTYHQPGGHVARAGKVCVLLDVGGANDRSFNEATLRGARQAAEEEGLEFVHIVSGAVSDYERNIDNFITEGCGLIITVGFLMADVTAAAARANPEVKFAIMEFIYFPGLGCDADVNDCYTEEGGLQNVASVVFAEDEAGYLAGALAGCMSQSGVIGSVAGMEIPPVVRYVTGYQNGAQWVHPEITTLNEYIPDFNDPAAGEEVARQMIAEGADVIFGVAGNTGNGGLLAAHQAGIVAIGVDVDQFFTYPEVASSLITSAVKNIEAAAAGVVHDYARGTLQPGIRWGTVANGEVGLAPYHDWEERIPAECRMAVEAAAAGLVDGSLSTGYTP